MPVESLRAGFIGGGALAESVIRGISGKLIESKNIFVSERNPERCEYLQKNYGVNVSGVADNFLDGLTLIIVAVKPKDAAVALDEIKNKVNPNTIVMSVVAGLKLKIVEDAFQKNPVFRIMPNVPIAVGEGMVAFVPGKNSEPADKETVKKCWSNVGRIVEVEENLMDAVTGLSGSGPAYGFLMIDALADGGVAAGLPRAKAVELAAQTLLGAAKMVLETGDHPDVLRDRVTSPAGTTIEGVRIMERCGVRSALIEAVLAATEKSKNL